MYSRHFAVYSVNCSPIVQNNTHKFDCFNSQTLLLFDIFSEPELMEVDAKDSKKRKKSKKEKKKKSKKSKKKKKKQKVSSSDSSDDGEDEWVEKDVMVSVAERRAKGEDEGEDEDGTIGIAVMSFIVFV